MLETYKPRRYTNGTDTSGKERINDSRLKVQSIANSLKHIDPSKVPHFTEIENCLEDADKSLGERSGPRLPIRPTSDFSAFSRPSRA